MKKAVFKAMGLILPICMAVVLLSVPKAKAEMNLAFDNMPRVVGLGFGVVPDYEGSDDYTFGIAPFARFQFGDTERYLLVKAYELQINLIDHPWFRLGPSLNYRFGRDDVDDKVVDDMKDIDDTVEAGGFIGVEFIDQANPRKRCMASVDFLADVGDEHDGYSIYFTAKAWYPVSEMFDIGLGAGFSYASENYMETYFGVDRRDSARSGLPMFEADSGIKDVRIYPMAIMHLSPNWHVGAGVQYRLMVGDADDSPVVDDRGSSSQWIAGIGVGYSW
jgi:outer membrane protein